MMDDRQLINVVLDEASIKRQGIKNRLGYPPGVHQALERGYPYPSAQSVGPLLDHHNARDVDDF
jgi:hypothetical protein